MQKVLLESPFAGTSSDPVEKKAQEDENVRYARACMRDSLLKGEAPYASHLLYTQEGILDDDILEERTQGIDAGLIWGAEADKTVIYVDRGFSRGMRYGVANALAADRPLEFRVLPDYFQEFGTTSVVDRRILSEFPVKDVDSLLKGFIADLQKVGKLPGEDFAEDVFALFNTTPTQDTAA